jgi:ferredoxin, 2Fe-2S
LAKVKYQRGDGTSEVHDVEPGTSLMRAAVFNSVAGIIGECGGQMMCATCHVYLLSDSPGFEPISDDETDILELAAAPVDGRSRLSCQLTVTEEVDVVEVLIPDTQL